MLSPLLVCVYVWSVGAHAHVDQSHVRCFSQSLRGLPLTLQFPDSARLAVQQALGTLLSLPPQN